MTLLISKSDFPGLVTAAEPLLLRQTEGERRAWEELRVLKVSLLATETALHHHIALNAELAAELESVKRALANERAAHVATMERRHGH